MMGARAQFFLNDPQDLAARVWLGCIAWYGYPDGDAESLKECRSGEDFRVAVGCLAVRDDFCDPATMDFPFPWEDDLFVTDCTYSFVNGVVMFNNSHHRPVPLLEWFDMTDEEKDRIPETLPRNVAAPRNIGAKRGPDSILYLRSAS